MQVTFVLRGDTEQRLDRAVKRRGSTRASVLRLALTEFLDADERVQATMNGLSMEQQERTIAGLMEAARWEGFGS